MKKNKNEISDSFEDLENLDKESGKNNHESSQVHENFSHFPVDEEMYLSADEADLRLLVEGSRAFSDDEEKQSGNKPESEDGSYPSIPFLVEVNSLNSLLNLPVSGKESEMERDGLLSDSEGCRDAASDGDTQGIAGHNNNDPR